MDTSRTHNRAPHSQWRRLQIWLYSQWRRLQIWLGDPLWLVFLLGVLSVICGAIGYQKLYPQQYTGWDYIYMSLQLFPLQMSVPLPPIPIELEIARFLSPAVTIITFIRLLWSAFRRQFRLLRLRFMHGHVIICGLGEKGMRLAREFKQQGRQVVVIEISDQNPNIALCEQMGVIVFIEDAQAQDALALENVGLVRASLLVAVCGDDSINAEIANQAHGIKNRKKDLRLLTCKVLIEDLRIWSLLRKIEINCSESASFHLELFNIFDNAARVLVRDLIFSEEASTPKLLIVGADQLAQRIIIQAARYWALRRAAGTEKLTIQIMDKDPQSTPYSEAGRIAGPQNMISIIHENYPLVETVCHLIPCEIDFKTKDLRYGLLAGDVQELRIDVTHIVVCLEDNAQNLSVALFILERLKSQKSEILVRMTENNGLSNLLQMTPEYKNIQLFGLLDRTCGPGLLDDGTHEALGRTIHEAWLSNPHSKGKPADMSWEELLKQSASDDYLCMVRNDNLSQAEDIGKKLNFINCSIVPWRVYEGKEFEFSAEEVAQLAKMEHERWVKVHQEHGGVYHPLRNDVAKPLRHPDMIPWTGEETDGLCFDVYLGQDGKSIKKMIQLCDKMPEKPAHAQHTVIGLTNITDADGLMIRSASLVRLDDTSSSSNIRVNLRLELQLAGAEKIEKVIDQWQNAWIESERCEADGLTVVSVRVHLTEDSKGYDRDTVKKIPLFLARVGFQIQRDNL